jgi:hypothetical protein
MSDADKVLIGLDGNPLLSVDGKIVLADDLYPKTAIPTGWVLSDTGLSYFNHIDDALAWKRSSSGTSAYPDFQSLLGAVDWASSIDSSELPVPLLSLLITENGASYDRLFETQLVKLPVTGWDTTLSWSRVKKLKLNFEVWPAYYYADWSTYDINFKAYIGQGSSVTDPSGSNEPWEGTGWSLLGEGSTSDPDAAIFTGSVDLTMRDSGGNIYLALWADNPASPNLVKQDAVVYITSISVVYNMATA